MFSCVIYSGQVVASDRAVIKFCCWLATIFTIHVTSFDKQFIRWLC